jgi:hypothetical protein
MHMFYSFSITAQDLHIVNGHEWKGFKPFRKHKTTMILENGPTLKIFCNHSSKTTNLRFFSFGGGGAPKNSVKSGTHCPYGHLAGIIPKSV